MLAVPEELRLLEAVAEEWSRRLVWPWPEPDVRVTVTLVGGGLGDRRSLGRDGGRGLDHRYRQRELVLHSDTVSHCKTNKWLALQKPQTRTDLGKTASVVSAAVL